MRQLLFIIICFSFIGAEAQNCKTTNTKIKVFVCGINMLRNDSMFCNQCADCLPGLRVSDSNFSIISYILRWDAAAIHLNAPNEVINNGAGFNEAKTIMDKLRPGIYLEFSCIKAKDRNGIIYTLSPMVFIAK